MPTPSPAIVSSYQGGSLSPDISNEEASTTSHEYSSNNQQRLPLHSAMSTDHYQHETPLPESIFLKYLPQGFNVKPIQLVISEIMGTFILVWCICGISATAQGQGGTLGLLEYSIAAGAATVVVVFTLGPVSGAHLSPSNTIAFAIFGHFPWSKVPFYVVGQVAGAALATYLGKLVYGMRPEVVLTVPFGGCAVAFWAELIASFMLTFLAVSMARNRKTVGQLMGLVMGIAVMLAVLITGPVSGGSLNPARSLGPAIVAMKFKHIWVYLVAPTGGAVLGVLMVHVLCLHRRVPIRSNN